MATARSATLGISIDRPWQEVYDFASDPANLTHWAAGLGAGFEHCGEDWTFRDPAGRPVRMRFTPRNPFGVLDHDVFPQGHDPVHIAMRVMPNGDGAEVTFLLLQRPGMSDAEFARDGEAVMKDLAALKSLMEA